AVLHEGVEGERRDRPGVELVGQVELDAQALAQARLLDLQIRLNHRDLVPQRPDVAARRIERGAEEVGELAEQPLGALRRLANLSRDRGDRVEEEVRMKARLERREPGVRGQTLGPLGLELLRAQPLARLVEASAGPLVDRDSYSDTERHHQRDAEARALDGPER